MKQSTIPLATRKSVLARAWGKCEECAHRAVLDLHHLHYRTVGEESPEDLKALCRDCHHAAHRDINGEYWRDPEEMAAHWWSYHEEMHKG